MPNVLKSLFAFADSEKLILNCLVVRNRVFDDSGVATSTLNSNTGYLHKVELVRNIATWVLEVTVENTLSDAKQVCFPYSLPTDCWQFRATLEPNDGLDKDEKVECKSKFRDKDRIKTTITLDSGHREQMSIGLSIKS